MSFFAQETEKLDSWADDLNVGLEREIKELDRKIKEAVLNPTDIVYFGSCKVPATRLLSGDVNLGENPYLSVSLHDQEIVFGRDPTCKQVLNYPMISWRHARLRPARSRR